MDLKKKSLSAVWEKRHGEGFGSGRQGFQNYQHEDFFFSFCQFH